MRTWRFLALALGGLLAAIGYNVLRLPGASAPRPAVALPDVDASAVAQRLAAALRIPTVTINDTTQVDWSRWPELHSHLAASFPRAHAALLRETVNRYSLLFTWPGTNAAAAPILLLAHQDVVPIEPGTESSWEHPPFAGEIADGFIWGRGALDDKASLMAQLEAAEWLLARGFEPARTVYFAFGHDEEIGGRAGAAALAGTLKARGVRAEFSLDEGGALTQGVIRGVDRPVATVATAEKGYVSFRLTARDAGGHSSRPPDITAIGRLAGAVSRLEHRQRPLRLGAPVDTMLERLAPALPFTSRLAIANLWLFRPLVARQLAQAPLTRALVRTTTAPTLFDAGIKDNILPTEARAVVNFRLLPGETIAGLETHVRAVVDDPAIELAPLEFASEPSAVSDPGTDSFRAIEETVLEVFPDALVAPGLVIGATDNRHYGEVYRERYNFLPLTITETDLQRVHGANERVAIDAYRRAVQFYIQLLRRTAGATLGGHPEE